MDPLLQMLQSLRDPGTALQIGIIALCAMLGWLGTRTVRRVFLGHHEPPGVGSFARVLTPLLTLLLISLARHWFLKGQHGHVLRIVVPLVVSLAAMRFGFYLVRRIFASDYRFANTLTLVEKLLAVMVWVGGLLYISGLWPELIEMLETTSLPLGKHPVSLATILQALASAMVMLTLALWAGAVLEQRIMAMDVVHSSLRVAMARTGRALLIFTGLLVSLTLVGIDLTVLSVFGGALGVGLGLGLQKIASNYVSGFVILLDRSLKIGDMIAVDKYYGKVTQINSRYTVLQGMDGIESVLPNEMLVSGAVQNFSLTNSSIRLGARMVLPVDADLLQLFPLFEAAVVKIERVLPDPAPDTALIKVSGDGLEVEVGFWINDPQNGRGGITSRVYQAMLAIVREHGLVLPGTTTPVVVHAATLAAVSANAAPTSETRSGGLSQ
ncbi:MAG: hypothetical protein RL748_938 [Pseudomonadota bacterium]|jgi:small-conductance mechanosensitive channel